MRRTLGPALIGLVLLAACSSATPAPSPGNNGDRPQGSSSAGQPRAGSVRAANPESAVQGFLRALGADDSRRACQYMAAGGRAIETEPQAMDMCVTTMGQASQQARQAMGEELKNATVAGITINGDHADVSHATVTPPAAARLVAGMEVIRLDGAWYITAPS